MSRLFFECKTILRVVGDDDEDKPCMIKIISYDLGGPETSDSYRRLTTAITSIGECVKPLESFFLVDSFLPCSSIRDELARVLDDNDKIIVAEANQSFSWNFLDPDLRNWIATHR